MNLVRADERPAVVSAVHELTAKRRLLHMACIMDGNGRWAEFRGLPRHEGHRAGVSAVIGAIEAALEMRVPWLTLYAFSASNWARDTEEVSFLTESREWPLGIEKARHLAANGAAFRVLGNFDDPRLRDSTVAFLHELAGLRASVAATEIVIAFNYDAERRGSEDWLPPVDLLFRTGGEQRLSGLLPEHTAQAELVFTDVMWPDVRAGHLVSAAAEYLQRTRTFGAVPTCVDASEPEASRAR